MTLIAIILNIYIWAGIGVLLFFLFSIARFFESKSKQKSYGQAFLGSIVLFSVAAIRYIFVNPQIVGDVWGDSLRFIAGLILAGFGIFLLRLMTGGRRT